MHDNKIFCMFGDECDKKHFKETCIDQECISSVCPKQYPRFFFLFLDSHFETANLEMIADIYITHKIPW